MQRGEVWEYDPVMRRDGRSTLRLILSADGWVADPEHRIVHGVHLLTEDQGGLVNVRTSLGWASITTLEPIVRRRLVTRVGALEPDELVAVAAAARAYLDL